MFNKRTIAALILGGTLAMAGCGRGNVAGTDPYGSPTPSPVNSTYPVDPNPPMPTPTLAPVLQPVTAQVASKSSYGGSWMCLGLCRKKVDAQISVTNPNSVEVSATLTITFTLNGQSVETQNQTVALQPGATQKKEFKATQTSDNVDDVTVSATNSNGCSGGSSGGTGGYPGSTGGYPGSTGGYPGSTGGTGGCASGTGGYPGSTGGTGGYTGSTGGYTGSTGGYTGSTGTPGY